MKTLNTKLVCLVLLAGCASVPYDQLSDADLCLRYDSGHPVRPEIDRRGLIAPEHWPLVEQGEIAVGMSDCALRAVWGYPDEVFHASYGDQWMYCPLSCDVRRHYFYVENGIVTAWN